METFKIRSYSKKELALCYFPTAENPRSASKHLMAWITRCTPLHEALLKQGYRNTNKWFKRGGVKLIVEYIGEPQPQKKRDKKYP